MKHIFRLGPGIAIFLAGAMAPNVIAGPVTIPNTFTAGTPARAAEVNANFTAVATAVNDNDARVKTLETSAAKPDVAPGGNLLLGPSTPTSGNVVKDGVRFLHDYGLGSTFLGRGAGNFRLSGTLNTGVGSAALALISTGHENTAVGASTLSSNSTGSYGTAIGSAALDNNTTGGSNTATGAFALTNNTTGNLNTAFGAQTLAVNSTASGNTAIGGGALYIKAAGDLNTAIGFGTLSYLTAGERNTALGPHAGSLLKSGDGNVYIANSGVTQESDTIRIGDSQIRTFVAGIRGVTTANVNAIPVVIDSQGQLGTVSSSRRFKDDIADMGDASSLLMRLRPVTFHYRSDQNPNGRTLQYGLVAEEVAAVAPGLVAHSRDGEIETVFYEFLPPMLLNELQKQQQTIDAQNKRLAQLEREVAALRK